jgi:hypothetical protein
VPHHQRWLFFHHDCPKGLYYPKSETVEISLELATNSCLKKKGGMELSLLTLSAVTGVSSVTQDPIDL